RRLSLILFNIQPHSVQNAEVDLCRRTTLLRSPSKPDHCCRGICLSTNAVQEHRPKIILGLWITFRSAPLEPSKSQLFVLRHTDAKGIQISESRLGFRMALISRCEEPSRGLRRVGCSPDAELKSAGKVDLRSNLTGLSSRAQVIDIEFPRLATQ